MSQEGLEHAMQDYCIIFYEDPYVKHDSALASPLSWQLSLIPVPRDPITLSEDDWGVQSPPQKGI